MNHIKDDIETVARLALAGYTFDETFDQYSRGQFPYYMYGHLVEINERLVVKGKGSISKNQKYPMIALRADVVAEKAAGMVNYSLNVAIFTNTSRGLNAEERTDQKFIPILIPIYNQFITALRTSGLFTWSGHPIPKHTYIERPFWGTPPGDSTTKQVLNDPVDCIELVNLELRKVNC